MMDVSPPTGQSEALAREAEAKSGANKSNLVNIVGDTAKLLQIQVAGSVVRRWHRGKVN